MCLQYSVVNIYFSSQTNIFTEVILLRVPGEGVVVLAGAEPPRAARHLPGGEVLVRPAPSRGLGWRDVES